MAAHRLSIRPGPMTQGPQPPDKGWCAVGHATPRLRHFVVAHAVVWMKAVFEETLGRS